MNVKQLKALEVNVEKGSIGQFRNLDSEFGRGNGINAKRAYNGSLDAAKALHEAVLPGWRWMLRSSCDAHVWDGDKESYSGVVSLNPARAWLLAIIRALIAQAEAGVTE